MCVQLAFVVLFTKLTWYHPIFSVDEPVLTKAIDIPAVVTTESFLTACQTEGFVVVSASLCPALIFFILTTSTRRGNTLGDSSVHASRLRQQIHLPKTV